MQSFWVKFGPNFPCLVCSSVLCAVSHLGAREWVGGPKTNGAIVSAEGTHLRDGRHSRGAEQSAIWHRQRFSLLKYITRTSLIKRLSAFSLSLNNTYTLEKQQHNGDGAKVVVCQTFWPHKSIRGGRRASHSMLNRQSTQFIRLYWCGLYYHTAQQICLQIANWSFCA